MMTPFRGEQTGEQNFARRNEKGNNRLRDRGTTPFSLDGSRGTGDKDEIKGTID